MSVPQQMKIKNENTGRSKQWYAEIPALGGVLKQPQKISPLHRLIYFASQQSCVDRLINVETLQKQVQVALHSPAVGHEDAFCYCNIIRTHF